jgi:sulfatase maturation enzyme AslB (radical SAM superfamily)
MKANSLSINIPYNGCDKDCQYCISKMTGYTKFDKYLYNRNLKKVKKIADNSGVNSVILTGKGEPLRNIEWVKRVSEVFEEYPLEIQTNGIVLDELYANILLSRGIDTIAISVDKWEDIQKASFITKLATLNFFRFNIRLTVNVVNDIYEHKPQEFIDYCNTYDVDQLSFRNVVVPTHRTGTVVSKYASKWIEKNIERKKVNTFLESLGNTLNNEKGTLVRSLPFGASIYMVDEVSITYFDYCIQDSSGDRDIRSLIYHEDGHLSTSWNGSNWGRIF